METKWSDAKKCSGCGMIKSLSGFSRKNSCRDGRDTRCKSCKSLSQSIYQKTVAGKIVHKRSGKNYASRHPRRNAAHRDISREIESGRIPPPSFLECKYCGNTAAQYHHPDYSKPKEVEPVCRKCHQKINEKQ